MNIQQILQALASFNTSIVVLESSGLIVGEGLTLLRDFYASVLAQLALQDITLETVSLEDKLTQQWENLVRARGLELPSRDGLTDVQYREALIALMQSVDVPK